MPETAPTVSVVILAWRLVGELERCVAAVRAQQGHFALEIVVVENDPPSNVHEAVLRAAPDRVVSSPVNRGYGGGCSLGIEATGSDYVVLLNDDAVPRPGWLAALVARADSDPTVGAVASLLLNDDLSIQEAGRRVRSDGRTLATADGLTVEAAREAGLLEVRDIDYGSGAALLMRRSALDEVGSFDRRYEPAYFEDVDLQFRLHRAGWRVVLEPEAVVVHSSGLSTAGGSLSYRDFLFDRSLRLFTERWSDVLAEIDDEQGQTALPPLAPIAEFGAPSRAAGAPSTSRLVFPGLEAEFEAWALDHFDDLGRRVDLFAATAELAERREEIAEASRVEAEHRAAAAVDEAETLRRRLAELETAHAELGALAGELRQRLDKFEANPLRRAAAAVRHAGDKG